jgi:hypothetical protein
MAGETASAVGSDILEEGIVAGECWPIRLE